MTRTALPLAAALLALAACATAEPEPAPSHSPPGDPDGTCGAAELQYLVGQPQSALAAMTFPSSTRFVGPSTAVTMDYNPERLNIRYDQQGIIIEVSCG